MENTRLDVPDAQTVQMIRAMKPWQRIAAVLDMNETARKRLGGFIRTHHPDWSDSQIAAEVARRMRGDSK